MRKLVLFDIDGTLLWTDGAGRAAIRAALLHEMGATGPIDGFRFDGKTDPQIIRELMHAAGHPRAADVERIAAVCARYVQLLESELPRHAGNVRLFPGVLDLLASIEQRGDGLLGLLTGNLARGARLKLRAAGLDPVRFRVGAFGSDAAERSALPPIAARRAVDLMGREPRGSDIVIIGDTPADMQCGQEVGARAIGVATGSYTTEDLLATGAHAAFADFGDADSVLAAIFD